MPAVLKSGRTLFGLVSSGGACHLEVLFSTAEDVEDPVPTVKLKAQGKHLAEELPLFTNQGNRTVSGYVVLSPAKGQKIEHQGVRAQLYGVIELVHAGVRNHEFLCLSRELLGAGELYETQKLPFAFQNVDMSMDSYRGNSVRLRYFLRVTLSRSIGGFSEDFPIWVQNPCDSMPEEEPIKLEVGIENCLHLEFTYSSSVYGTDGHVLGSVHFKLVKISFKTMELEVRRKEITTGGGKSSPDIQTLYKYEIMDGAPVRGELLPVRLYLGPLELSPTYEAVQNKFSVKYYLNLVLVDSEDRRYFKQHEIVLVRRPPAPAMPITDAASEEHEDDALCAAADQEW